jgi:hypothetical protein
LEELPDGSSKGFPGKAGQLPRSIEYFNIITTEQGLLHGFRIPTSCVGWLFKSAERALQQFFMGFDWASCELDGRRVEVVSASCRGCGGHLFSFRVYPGTESLGVVNQSSSH